MASDTPQYEFLWIVREASYGTEIGTPVAGTDSIYIRLAGANRFTMRPKRIDRKIGWGGGYAVAGFKVSDKWEYKGNLQVELSYVQAALLLEWALSKSNGSTTPYTNTFDPGDTTSCAVYHGVMRSDGTIKRVRYKGVKVETCKIEASSESGVTMLTLGLVGQSHDGNPNAPTPTTDPDATAFPAPAYAAFPTDLALFSQTTVAVGGSTVTYAESVTHTVGNGLAPKYYAGSPFLVSNRLRGRASTAELKALYTASPSWRTRYEAGTALAVSTVLTNTTHTLTISHNANNVVDDLSDDLTPGAEYMQSVTLENRWDGSAADDVTFTFA